MRQVCLFLSLVLLPFATLAGARLPNYLIRIPESLTTVFVAETSTAKFHRFERVGGDMQYAGSDYMSIGRNGVGKRKTGDRRTPLGIYFVTQELNTQRLHQKYGVTAFVLDYPNAWDQRLERSGDGIWVHGVDPAGGTRPPRDTDGCIALPNDSLDALDGAFLDNVTPVLISRIVEWSEPEARTTIATELENQLQLWSSSRIRGDLHAYLSLYDKDFERWEMNKSEWATLNLDAFGEGAISDLMIDDLLILSYPDASEIYLTRFQQTIDDGNTRRVSTKRLYWHRTAGGALRIITEDEG